LARRLGATEAQLDALSRASYDDFEPAWQAAFRWADAMTPTRAVPNDATFAELARHWSSAQIVEITAVITLFNYFNRFATSLDIPVTR
jgi:alkylhydroperoxidase family enzyme